jgi:hypothetical protein
VKGTHRVDDQTSGRFTESVYLHFRACRDRVALVQTACRRKVQNLSKKMLALPDWTADVTEEASFAIEVGRGLMRSKAAGVK